MLTHERLREVLIYDPDTGLWTWRITVSNRAKAGARAGCRRNDGYHLIRVDGRLYLAHRLAWLYMTGGWPEREIDHADGNPSDNRWANLRLATHAQNITNQTAHRDNRLGAKGIRHHRNGRFYVQVAGRACGGYPTLEEAKAAYSAAAQVAHGEFYRE